MNMTQTLIDKIDDYLINYHSNDIPLIKASKMYSKVISVGIFNLEEKIALNKSSEAEFNNLPENEKIEFINYLNKRNKEIIQGKY